MNTGKILIFDNGESVVRQAILVETLDSDKVLVCTFTQSGPVMMVATLGDTQTLMVYVPD